MTGIARELARSFASVTKWKQAFAAIEDSSPILVAGMAESIAVTGFEKESDRVYYMATERGLHVGQQTPSSGFFRGTAYVDHFLPREMIIGFDTDFINTIQFDASDGTRMWFSDIFSQLNGSGVEHLPAIAQGEMLARALGWPLERRPARED
jgi:hypothetical protein